MPEESRYNVLRDEVVPLLKDIADNLGNLISAHTREMDSRKADSEKHELLITLKVNSETMKNKMDDFIFNSNKIYAGFNQKQQDLELKVTKIMTIGGAIVFALSILAHFLGK